MQGGKTLFLVLRSWSPKLAKNFAGLGMLIRPVLVYALPGQRITPTDVASHLYKHSQIATPPPGQSVASHTCKCWLPRYTTSVHYTHPLLSYSCAYSICATRHPCPLSSPSSCCSPAHGCTHSRHCSVWSSCCYVAVSVSFSGSSLRRNHGAATKHEDDEAATPRHKSAT